MNREVVIKLFKKVARILEDDKQYEWLADEVKDYLNEMYVDEELGVKPKQEAEAWIIVNKETGYRTQVSDLTPFLYHREIFEVIPLYTAPSTCEPLSDEPKNAEAKLEQSLKDSIDEERIRQIMIDCISYD